MREKTISELKIAANQEAVVTQFGSSIAYAKLEHPASHEAAAVAQVQGHSPAPVPHPTVMPVQQAAIAPAAVAPIHQPAVSPHPLRQPCASASAIWREVQPAHKQLGLAAERESLPPLAPMTLELPCELEPVSMQATASAPERGLITKPTAVATATWRQDQPISKPLSNSAPEAHSGVLHARTPGTRTGSWYSDSSSLNGQEPAKALQVAQEQRAPETPRRISGLRGILLSLGIREMGAASDSMTNGNGARANSLKTEPQAGQPAPMETFAVPVTPELEPVSVLVSAPLPTEPARTDTRGFFPSRMSAEPEFLHPTVETVENRKESHKRNGPGARQERGKAFDNIEILPSWRGQYKRRG